MELINPIGKSLDSTITPAACYCAVSSMYATGRTPNDTCANCGCYCQEIIIWTYNYSGTRSVAEAPYRKS